MKFPEVVTETFLRYIHPQEGPTGYIHLVLGVGPI